MTSNLLLCARNSTMPIVHQLVETGKELKIGESFEYGSYYQSLLNKSTEKYFENSELEPGIYKVINVDKNESEQFLNVKLQLT